MRERCESVNSPELPASRCRPSASTNDEGCARRLSIVRRLSRLPGNIVPLVQFIKRVQAHGYTLEEIRELLALAEHGTHVAETVCDRAKKKVQQIEAEIARLCGIRDWLMQFVSQSERGVVRCRATSSSR
jgi:hypothetical protein